MSEIIRFPIKKTKISYVRIYDAFHRIDAVDASGGRGQKSGELRVILYLEDMGPVSMLDDRKEGINQEYAQFVKENIGDDEPLGIDMKEAQGGPGGQLAYSEDALQQTMILKQIMDLESKVIWELENWKKAEEAKFKYDLKQKEVEYMEELQKKRRNVEIEREMVFKEHEAKLKNLNKKMQQKVNKLTQRENKLILLEEELKQKINETSRQMVAKDEEIEKEKVKSGESRKNLIKKIKSLEKKVDNLEAENQEIKEEFAAYRKEQEDSPVQLIKNDLSGKLLEIDELKKQLEKSEEIKNEYRKHFERLKKEIMRLRQEKNELKVQASKEKEDDLKLIKDHMTIIAKLNDNAQIQNLRQDLNNLRGTNEYGAGHTGDFNAFMSSKRSRPGQSKLEVSEVQNKMRLDRVSQANLKMSNLQRLKVEREQFLLQGYADDDPVILEMDKIIKQLNQV